jgi:outer membrane protein TolC
MNNQLEYRLALEYFKPKFDVVLRIQESGNNFMNSDFDVMQNHYIGGKFAIPLLYRQQRAKAGMAKTKAEMIGNKKVLTQRELETKYESVINNISNLATMVKIWEDASKNYRTMLDAENQKFRIGESTLFVVNMREMQWIEGRTKYIQTYAKYRKELLKAYYTLGILPSIL